MDPSERAKLGRAGRTTAEVDAAVEASTEKSIHQLICQELNRRGIKYIHAAMNKRSTLPEGAPDFCVFLPGQNRSAGQVVFAEIKTPSGKLSQSQSFYIAELRRDGFAVFVPRSFEEFKRDVLGILADELR